MRVAWTWCVDGAVPAELGWLGPRERDVLDGLRVPKRRSDWLRGRWIAKRLVAEQTGLGPGDFEILAAETGAPVARRGDAPLPISLSLSHSGDRALAAVGPMGLRLGVDMERLVPRSAGLLTDFFTVAEQAAVAEAADAVVLANAIWSLKESGLKALQVGLRIDTRAVVVDVAEPLDGTWRPAMVAFVDGPRLWAWARVEAGYLMSAAADAPFAIDRRDPARGGR